MPIYEYKCDCGNYEQRFLSIHRMETEAQHCVGCEAVMQKQISLPARMKDAWAAGWRDGLGSAGKFDAGLGKTIYSERQRDKELRSRGLVRATDLGPDHVFDTMLDKQVATEREQTATLTDISAKLAKHGNTAEAWDKAMPAHEILAGKFDHI